MAGIRRVGRVLGSSALTVAVGVAVNQILSEGEFSWTWLYVSLAVAVLAFLYTETRVPSTPGGDTARGGRRVYLRQLRASVRDMETVGVATHSEFVLRMHQVYVDVSLAPRTLQAAAGEPYLGSVPGAEAAAPGRRRNLESVLRDAEQGAAARVLAVLGGPGSGKTMLARNTALAMCERRWWPWERRRLPVLLYLRDHAAALLADEAPRLGTVAVSAGWLEGKVSAGWLERRLDAGGCVVLLDGLDEVADAAERGRVIAWVVRQTQRHPRNIYVVTSRPHGYQSNPLPGAEVLQVRRFTGEQISRFLHRWTYATESRARAFTRREAQAGEDRLPARLRARADTRREVRSAADRIAEDLLARLQAQPALYDLASNPLLLTMIANVHRYRGQLPGSRAELYAEMCDVLLHRRYEARGLRDATGLGGPHKQHVVQHLALAMMRARVRDWPVRDAVTAIRHPLRQVPRNVAPELFLDEARKSGLLVERDHGLYGFAHLTLQEYLAAALLGSPHADTGLLTGNVGDPWWRETVLLWSARNDATDVITACLDSGTVPALALAFECADQARTVAPDTRARLQDVLDNSPSDRSADPARERLLTGIQATRALRATIALNETTELCVHPVTRDLYDLFVRDERAAGLHHPESFDTGGDNDGTAAAVGMHAGDAERFVAWLNAVTDSHVHRLPRPEEVPAPAELPASASALADHLTRHTVWADDGTRTLLHQPPDVPWPYTPSAERVRSTPAADRREATRLLRLLIATPPQRARVEGWIRVLVTAIAQAPALPGNPALAPLESALARSVAFSVARARTRITAFTPGELALQYIQDLVGALDLHRTGDPARALTHAHDHARGLRDRLDRAIHEAHDITRVSTLSRIQQPVRALTADLARADAFARALGPGLARALAPALEDTPAGELGYALAFALDHPDAADLVGDLGPVGDLDLALERVHDFALSRELAHEFEPALDLSLDHGEILDEVLDLALVSHTPAVRIAVSAFLTFPDVSVPPGQESPSALVNLDTYLTAIGQIASLGLTTRGSEDPASSLRRVQGFLRNPPSDTRAQPLFHRARTLVNESLELITTVRDRHTPPDTRALACARLGLLAATNALDIVGRRGDEATALVHAARHGLIAHQHPAEAAYAPNQSLVIVRGDPLAELPRATPRSR